MKAYLDNKRIHLIEYILLPFIVTLIFFCPMNCYAEDLPVNGYVFWADSYEEALSLGEEYEAELLEYEDGIGVIEVTPEIENADAVFYPNYEYEVEGYQWEQTSNSQWHMEALKMYDAHKYTTGEGVKVAIIDSGIDVENPALKKNIIYAESTIPNSFYGESGFSINYKGPQDYNGHGTHIAGLIGAHSDNGMIVGMAPDCSIISIKAVEKKNNTATGYTSWIAKAVLKAVDLGADIINMSLGGSTKKDEFLAEAIKIAKESGVLVICAAGNYIGSGEQGIVDFPASDPNTIAVSAVKLSGSELIFDNAYSKFGEMITVSAPGSKLKSLGLDGAEKILSGTSMACSIVSGEAALIKSYYPDMPATEIEAYLTKNSLDLGEKGWDSLYGYGLIQPLEALKALDKDKKQPDNDSHKQHEQSPVKSDNNSDTEELTQDTIANESENSATSDAAEESIMENYTQLEKNEVDKQKTRRGQLEETLNHLSPEDEVLYTIQEAEETNEEAVIIEEDIELEEALQEETLQEEAIQKDSIADYREAYFIIAFILIGMAGICVHFLRT